MNHNVLVPARRENKAAQLIGAVQAVAADNCKSINSALPFVRGVRGVLPSTESDAWDNMTDPQLASYIADAIVSTFESGLNAEYRKANKEFVDNSLRLFSKLGGRPTVKRAKRITFNVELAQSNDETESTNETESAS